MTPTDPQGDLLPPSPPRPGPPASSPPAPPWKDIAQQMHDFRRLLLAALAGLILLCLGVDAFILKQIRLIRSQTAEMQPRLTEASKEFRNVREPAFRAFIGLLHHYSQTNRDFLPTYERYRAVLGRYYPPGAPAVTAPVLTNRPSDAFRGPRK